MTAYTRQAPMPAADVPQKVPPADAPALNPVDRSLEEWRLEVEGQVCQALLDKQPAWRQG